MSDPAGELGAEEAPARGDPERAPRWITRLGLLMLLALLAGPWLVRRPDVAPPRTPAPELEVEALALSADPERPPAEGAPERLPRGGTGWLHLALREPGNLAVLRSAPRAAGGGLELVARGPLREGVQVLPLRLPPEGDRVSFVLLLTAEPLEEERVRELTTALDVVGPWLRPVLLHELRAEGVPLPVARVYGASAGLE